MGFVCWKRHLARPDDKSQRLKEKEMTFVRSIAVVFGAALVRKPERKPDEKAAAEEAAPEEGA